MSVDDDAILVIHDLVPAASPLRSMLRRLLLAPTVAIDTGSRTKPLTNGALLREVAERARCRVFTARNAQVVRAGTAECPVRSVVPIAHPVLLTLRQFEHWASLDRADADPGEPDAATVTNRMAAALAAERPAYPFCNLQTGFYAASGLAQPRGRPASVQDAVRLAESLPEAALLVLPDFAEALQNRLRNLFRAADVPLRAPSASEQQASAADMVVELQRWRERLPADVFRRVCELNRADLVLLDHVFRLHADQVCGDPVVVHAVRKALADAAQITGHRGSSAKPPRAAPASRPGTDEAAAVPPQGSIVEPDPVLGWRNRAHSTLEVRLLGRQVVLDTDASGCRVVAGQPARGMRTLALYGCSLTFGWGVPSDATFASRLQARWPDWRVENHGINAHGTVHNYLALQRNQRWAPADFVSFCWAGEHRRRNVADVPFVLTRTPRGNDPASRVAGEMTPRACLDEAGRLTIRPVALPRPDLREVDLADFAPDPYLLELVSFRLIESAAEVVRDAGGHFFLTVLRTGLTPIMRGWLDAAGIPVVEALLPSDEYTNLPEDHHPNAAGHALFAERIGAHLLNLVSPDEVGAASALVAAG